MKDLSEGEDMKLDQKRISTGVRWPDEAQEQVPICEIISGSAVEKAQRPSDIQKITVHKRYPSYKIKPIIK